jgi:hypothetical protein
MKLRSLKSIALVLACAVLMVAAEKKDIPEYIGSQACLGCHSEKYSQWKPSNHTTMVVPVINSSNLPLEIAKAPANLQPELRKAAYMVANSFFLARDPATERTTRRWVFPMTRRRRFTCLQTSVRTGPPPARDATRPI